MDFSDLAWDRF